MKFYKLFKKEIKELITLQAVIGAVVIAVMFLLLGNVMNTITDNFSKNEYSVIICDIDNTELTKNAINHLTNQGVKVIPVENKSDTELIAFAKTQDHSSVLVIPKGFSSGILDEKQQKVRTVSALTSFALTSDTDNSAIEASEMISDYISSTTGVEGNFDAEFIKTPIIEENTTVVGNKTAIANPDMLKSFGMSQSMFIPIIVFLLVTLAVQLNCAAIANEKTDKTLETLLSTPVSRLDVIGSKMCASAVYSILMAVMFIGAYALFMGNMMGGSASAGGVNGAAVLSESQGISAALTALGIKLTGFHFTLLGIQLFFTIAIALTISMILGALAKDIKSTQGLITPIMFATMIPYFVTMFADINALPTVIKSLLYAIPFTHTFAATGNALFGNMGMFYFGLIYQAIWLVGVVWLAVRVFSSDKIFTMTLEFKPRAKKIKAKAE